MTMKNKCVGDGVFVCINTLFCWVESLILFANQEQPNEFYFKFYDSLLHEKKK